jgi:hypothetical protein
MSNMVHPYLTLLPISGFLFDKGTEELQGMILLLSVILIIHYKLRIGV